MKSTNKLHRIFTLIVISLSALVLIVLFNSNLNNQKSEKTTVGSSPANTAENSSQSINQTFSQKSLLVAERSLEHTDIIKINAADGSRKIIYTDKDETEKIKSLSNLTSSGKFIVVMADKNSEFVGNLYLISSDGSAKKEKLVENFASASAPLVSPDGQKICYTQFSNAEADYGFRLIVANKDNSSKHDIADDITSLTIYSWDQDSAIIYYSKGENQNKISLYSYNLSGNKESLVTTLDGYINSLSYVSDNQFILSLSPDLKQYTKAEIYKLANQKLSALTHNQTYDNFPAMTAENILAYSSLDYQGGQSVFFLTGKIIELDESYKGSKELGSANYILGWLE